MNLTHVGRIYVGETWVIKTLLSVLDLGISSHFRMYMLTRESTILITKVLGIAATVKWQDSFGKTEQM